MPEEILLPSSQYINTNLGLKYLNSNQKLYLKILNSFLVRYQSFDINSISKNEFKNEMHTLKGLSSTLGMELLSNLAKKLHAEQTEELLLDFSKTLKNIIEALNTIQTKTLLIIDDNPNDIDILVEMLKDKYDVMVITTPTDDLKSLATEDIDIVLLNSTLNTPEISNILEQKKISIIDLPKPINENNLKVAIKSV